MANLWEKPEEEELDLDYGEDPTLDPEYEAPNEYDRGSRAPLPGSVEFHVDWEPIRQKLVEHRISKGIGEDGKKAARKRVLSEAQDVTVTEPGHFVGVNEFPSSARAIAKRALASGWEVKGMLSRAHHAAVLFQDDSKPDKEGGGKKQQEHKRGDVRYPAEEREHFALHAKLLHEGQLIAALRAIYEARPAETKAGLAWKFEGAWGQDAVLGRMPFASRSGDGMSAFTSVAAEFSDWFDIFVPPAKARALRKSLDEKRADRLAAPMETGEWHG